MGTVKDRNGMDLTDYGQKGPWGRKQLDTAECAKLQMSPLGQVLFMGKSANI